MGISARGLVGLGGWLRQIFIDDKQMGFVDELYVVHGNVFFVQGMS